MARKGWLVHETRCRGWRGESFRDDDRPAERRERGRAPELTPAFPLAAPPATTLAACTPEQWKQYIEMRKLVCIVGQLQRRAGDAGVCLSVCLSSFNQPPSLSREPVSPFSSLCLLPFVSVGLLRSYVRGLNSAPALSFSLARWHPLPAATAVFPVHASFSFFSSAKRDVPASFPIARLKERIVNRRMSCGFRNGDCSIRRRGGGFSRGARAPTRPVRAHQQLVGEISPSSRSILIS